MEAMISGMVMNGPTPNMLLMLSAQACNRPNPQAGPSSSALLLRSGAKILGFRGGVGPKAQSRDISEVGCIQSPQGRFPDNRAGRDGEVQFPAPWTAD